MGTDYEKKVEELSKGKKSLFIDTIKKLERLISSGSYAVGSKLPSERQLCEQLNVSRTVLREALRALESKGILETYPGKGIFVSQPKFETIITPIEHLISVGEIDVFDLTQARFFLEPSIAHVAAIRATDEDIAIMEDSLREMKEAENQGDRFIEADQRFHMAIAMATKNPVLYIMARAIVESLTILRKTVYEQAGAPADAIRRHENVLNAVKLKDSKGAYQEMEAHIMDVEEYQHVRLTQKSLERYDFSNRNKNIEEQI